MKLIKFDCTNARSQRVGESTIRFHRQGQISISKKFCEELGLKAGTPVSVVQDEETPEDWYLVINDKDGFPLRKYNDGNMAFNSAFIAKSFLEAMGYENAISGGCLLATKETDSNGEIPKGASLYALITSSLICREIKAVESDGAHDE